MRSKNQFILFTLFLLCAIWCPHQSYAQTISPGTVAFDGMLIDSEVPDGAIYVGIRQIRSSDLRIASEEWTETLPNGTVNQGIKPPESEVYTFAVNARGQGQIDLELAPNGAATYDVGSFHETDVQPTSLTVNKEFSVHSRARCTNVRPYEKGYVPSYYDTCIPIANEGYKSEVSQDTESLDAEASVTPWDISVVYGTEKQITKTLGFGGGWPPNVGANAGWGNTDTQKWGWKLEKKADKKKQSKINDPYFPSYSGSFNVIFDDTYVSDENPPVNTEDCVECPNCLGSVNTDEDHVRKVSDVDGNNVLAICPLGAGGDSQGCGKRIYECTPEETARHDAWHMERTCTNESVFALGQLTRLGDPVCGAKFRHCTQSDCYFRYKTGRGHSDGSVSEAPTGVTNAYAESHILETPPDDGDDDDGELVSTTSSPGLSPTNGSYYASLGDTHEATVITSEAYYYVHWYVASPNDVGLGTLIETDEGWQSGGTETEASFSYTFSTNAVSGEYTITAVSERYSDLSQGSTRSYTVTVQ